MVHELQPDPMTICVSGSSPGDLGLWLCLSAMLCIVNVVPWLTIAYIACHFEAQIQAVSNR
jgi:hypothetical protein